MEIFLVLACLILNGLLAAAEMAFVSVGRPQLRALAAKGIKSAKILLELKSRPERVLSVIQVGITLVGAVAAAVSGAGADEKLSPLLQERFQIHESTAEIIAILVIILPLTYLNVVFGELVPKTISLRRPMKIALIAAPWLRYFENLFSPVISVFEKSTKLALAWWLPKNERATEVSTDDIVELGNLQTQTKQYVLNMIHAEKMKARDIMVPWDAVNRLRKEMSATEVESIVLQSGHTRMPVLDGEDLVGLLHTKEFMSLLKANQREWQKHIRPLLKFRAGEPILNILLKMQESRNHLAAVYQGFNPVGVITLEDIVEEIIGDLFDEDDDGRMRKFLARFRQSSRI